MTRRECEKSRQQRDWNRDKVKKDVLWLSFKGIINEFEMDVFGTHTHTYALHTHTHLHTGKATERLIEVIILARFIFELEIVL